MPLRGVVVWPSCSNSDGLRTGARLMPICRDLGTPRGSRAASTGFDSASDVFRRRGLATIFSSTWVNTLVSSLVVIVDSMRGEQRGARASTPATLPTNIIYIENMPRDIARRLGAAAADDIVRLAQAAHGRAKNDFVQRPGLSADLTSCLSPRILSDGIHLYIVFGIPGPGHDDIKALIYGNKR